MKNLLLVLALLNLHVAGAEPLIKPQTQGGVMFISGGVGGDEQNEMQALRSDYNMYLLFATQGTGEYVSDVIVRIDDANGNTLMESTADGPMLYAKLKPGRYNVTAVYDGLEQRKTTTVTRNRKASLFFTWPQHQED